MAGNNQILEMEIINRYKETASRMMRYSYPMLSNLEISKALDFSILNRVQGAPCYIDNNYKNKKVELTVLELSEYIMKRQPIMTPYGVLFKKHGEEPNPIAKLLQTFMENRDIHKSQMFQYPKGSEMFEKYNLLQLLDKIDANGSYGAIGQYSCLFYNIYVAASVTMQGRSSISAAGLFFEAFLANNVKFGSLNEVITFIDNVVNEKHERHYDDALILDKNINRDECFYRIMSNCGFNYVPDDEDLNIVWDIVCNLDQEDLNRLFYKNNLYGFMDNKSMTKAIRYLLQLMNEPYLDPRIGKIPKEIEVELKEFCSLLKEYVYYHYQYIDRLDKYDHMIRSVCVITDTDSTIISLDAWYRYTLEKVKDLDLKIKREKIDIIERFKADEFGDRPLRKVIERVETPTDYDFYEDDIVALQKTIEPLKIIPQEGLRYSILNIMGYCLSDLILDYMERYTKNSHSYAEDKKCLIIMKNEFLFKRILLTDAKKFYASIQELQEGHIIKGGKPDIKGLSMTKSTLKESTRNRLEEILVEEILDSDEISQIAVLKKIAKFEKEIYNSLLSGSKEYYKPAKIKSMGAYPEPMRIQGIKASVAWNELRTGVESAIDLSESNAIDIVKVDINLKTIDKIKDTYPDMYVKVLNLLQQPDFVKGLTSIAIPRDENTPEWVTEFIDYNTIVSDNAANLPIESIGLYRGLKNNSFTNILSI